MNRQRRRSRGSPIILQSSSRVAVDDVLKTTMAHLHDEAYIRSVPSPYTPSQVNEYLEHIAWSRPTTSDSAFDALSDLMLMHGTTFPSENTDLH